MSNGEHIPEVVQAKRFELVDDDGNLCAALGFIPPRNVSHDESEGAPHDERDTLIIQQITNFLQEQLHREGASGNEEMPFMALFDKEGSTKMALLLGEDGNPNIMLMDKESSAKIVLWLSEDGASNIRLMGKEGSGISFQLDKDGNHLIFFREGAPQLIVDLDEDGPALTLASKDKSNSISLRIGEGGSALRLIRNVNNLPEGQSISISLDTDSDRLALSLVREDEAVLAVSLDENSDPHISIIDLNEGTPKSLI